ncbi:MAG: leucine-rich repeat domain-containing protein [Oscillospiraceae bacterium]|nr:leucine-rich repeat domain-containing protein [Oscillospiraceae bacterium]
MKRYLWAIILAMLLAVTLIPTPAAQATGEEAALIYRDVDTSNGTLNSDYYSTEYSCTVGYYRYVKFFFIDGETEIEVSPHDLIWSDLIEITTETDGDYCRVMATKIGNGTIDYVHDGVTYSMPVNIFMAAFDFYTTEIPSAESHILDLRITSLPYVLYYAARDGYTLTAFTLAEEWNGLAVAEKVSDTCWRITINELVGNGQPLHFTYSGTYSDGTTFTDYELFVRTTDAMPGLRYRSMSWGGDAYYEDPAAPLYGTLIEEIGNRSYVNFYFFDGENEFPLTLDDLTIPDCLTVEPSYDGTCYYVDAVSFGDGAITYTRGGVTYSLPVYISLPTFWFYSTPAPSTESYLAELRITELGQSFYFVTDGTVTIPTLTLSGDCQKIAHAEQISDTCWKITFTGLPSDIGYSNMSCTVRFDYLSEYDTLYTDYVRYIPIVDATPSLKYRYMSWDSSIGERYEDLTRPLSSAWIEAIGYATPVKFYFFDGENEIPVSPDELILPDFVTLREAESTDYFWLDAAAFGEGSIRYVYNGKTYSLPVSVTLPEVGFYSSETPSIDTYLSEFRVTGEDSVFYFISNCEYRLTDVRPDASFLQAEKVNDYCWKLTVTGQIDTNSRRIYFDRENDSGHTITNDSRFLSLIDRTPGLRYRYGNSENDLLYNAWNIEVDYYSYVLFYFFDGENEYPVSPDELILPELVEIVWSDYDNRYEIHGVRPGSGTIDYVRDGVTYSLPVSVTLPEFGFYSSTTVSEATYLTEFKLTEQNNSFYFVAQGGATLTSVTLEEDFADIATVKQISDACWKITINALTDSSNWLEIRYSGTNQWGSSFTDYYDSIKIVDRTPGLKLRYMTWSADGMYEDLTTPLISSWDGRMNTFSYVKLYFFDGENEFPVSPDELIIPGCVSVQSVSETDYYRISSRRLGKGEISYERDGVIWTLPVTVDLPDFGFYSAPTASKETYLSELNLTSGSNVFYFIVRNDYYTLSNVTPDSAYAKTATVTQISDNCWKITLSGDVKAGQWFYIDYTMTTSGSSFNSGNGIFIASVTPKLIASGTCGADLEWTLDANGLLTISGTGAMDNYSTSKRAPWYGKRSKITTVTISSGVTSIGESAFYNCTKLQSISIAEGITAIGKQALRGCTALTDVTISETVTAIGTGAFMGCTALTEISLPDSVTLIESSLFSGCTRLQTVELGKNLETISANAFQNCSALAGIAIPASVVSIGKNAFTGCSALTKISLPDSVTVVESYLFSGCTKLEEVGLGIRVEKINSYAFRTAPGSQPSPCPTVSRASALTPLPIAPPLRISSSPQA